MAAKVNRVELVSNTILRVDKITPRGQRTIGHEFKVAIEVEDIRNCILEWWERTDEARPYHSGLTTNRWGNLFELEPNSAVFEAWNREVRLVPLGPARFELKDTPGIMVNECGQRELCFEIRVKERIGYGDGPFKQRRIRARELLGFGKSPHALLVTENNQETDAEAGPPLW